MIELGDKAKDKVTGFTGIVRGICYYLQGCRHIEVQPQELHEGKPIAGIWFDEPQLEIIEKQVITPLNTSEPLLNSESKNKKTGGPMLSTPPKK